jgi:hypothetical protein
MEITKIWQKSRDFWVADFFLEIFKTHRLVWIFLWFFGCLKSVSSKFCLKLFLILVLQMQLYQRLPFGSIPILIIGWCLVRQRDP